MRTWRLAWRLACYRPLLFWISVLVWLAFYCVPLGSGLAARAVFDALAGGGRAGVGVWSAIALVGAVEVTRVLVFIVAMLFWNAWYLMSLTLIRRNVLAWIVAGPGTRRLPDSPGEAVNRFRDDAIELVEFVDSWLDFGGLALFSVIALVIMLRISLPIALIVAVPLGATVLITRLLTGRIKRYRAANREATGQVTGFIGEIFGAAQALKLAGAETHVLERFRRLSDARRSAAVNDRLCLELLNALNLNTANLSVGVVLLLAARAMRAGSFTVGDFTLFVSYLTTLASLPRWAGWLMARHKQAGVSIHRLERLLEGAPPRTLVAPAPLHLDAAPPPIAAPSRTRSDRLQLLEVDGLTYRYADMDGRPRRGVINVNLRLPRGSFTVITGSIGSGKTTFLRVLLGLLPTQGGTIRWNGQYVTDPASFFIPPRCAYTPQSPRLFSESLRDNVLLGQPVDGTALMAALELAALEEDLVVMNDGLDTLLGPRGVRLSGGQIQRVAAARMFVQLPELLVFDDLSSALDVETEALLWDRLFARRDVTCLVVSHRRAARNRADQVLDSEQWTVDSGQWGAVGSGQSAVMSITGHL